MFSIVNKHILVTGSNGQLGSHIVKTLEGLGAVVYKIDIDTVDITDGEAINKYFDKNQQIEVVINNAGSFRTLNDSENREEDEFDHVMDVNLKGTFNVIRSFISHRLNGGNIINIGSIYGIISPDFETYELRDIKSSEIYGATKAGIIQMTKYFARYMAKSGMRVNCISPAGIYDETVHKITEEFNDKYCERIPMKRMANVEEIMGGIVYLASDASSYVTGHNLIIDGGMST